MPAIVGKCQLSGLIGRLPAALECRPPSGARAHQSSINRATGSRIHSESLLNALDFESSLIQNRP